MVIWMLFITGYLCQCYTQFENNLEGYPPKGTQGRMERKIVKSNMQQLETICSSNKGLKA